MTGTVNTSWYRESLKPFQQASLARSYWQLINTLFPFFFLWYVMYQSVFISYWLTLLLAIPTAGFYIRLFIIFHDCGHGSFFKQRWVNDLVGNILSVIVLVPYYQWNHDHAVHHATSGNLDKRGIGDVWTLTIEEYNALSDSHKILYRIYRNPFFLLLLAPLLKFIIVERLPTHAGNKREYWSAHCTTLMIVFLFGLMHFFLGSWKFLLVQLPIIQIAGIFGVWLFYVQHQYEDTFWVNKSEWNMVTSSLKGSSFVKLPAVLNWLSGSIGYHHIHHLSSRIPNYNLAKCHEVIPQFKSIQPLTLRSALQALNLALWDTKNCKLVSFKSMKSQVGQPEIA